MKKGLRIIGIILIVIVILLIVVYLGDYIIYSKTKKSILFFRDKDVTAQEEEKNKNEVKSKNKIELKKENKELDSNELEEIATFLNREENNGFILSSYEEIMKIDLYYLFTKDKYLVKEEEEFKKYKDLTNSEVTTGLFKVSIKEIEATLEDKFGIKVNQDNIRVMKMENFVYSPAEESYYFLNSDDLFTKVKCISGTKVDNTYEIHYESEEKTGNYIKGTVILFKADSLDGKNNWHFVSNKVEETNLY